ncbi:MAG TPA: secretin N-terminal domain-containing protein [Spirochaetota bacterium]|nr:secretin N-terminal domain-containing protein [Spirochaetota bacterium]
MRSHFRGLKGFPLLIIAVTATVTVTSLQIFAQRTAAPVSAEKAPVSANTAQAGAAKDAKTADKKEEPKIVIQIDDSENKVSKKILVPPEPKKAAPAGSTRKILLNFNNVELSELLNVMGQIANKNIIIDDKVRGKITISSSRKIPVDRAIDVLRAILDVRGMALVETEHFIKVVPIREAVQGTVKVYSEEEKARLKDGGEIITYLHQLQNADVKEVNNVIRSLKTKDSDVVIYPPENILIIRGTADEVNGLIRITKSLDLAIKEMEEDGKAAPEKKPTGRIHVMHLENADANELASVLSRVPFSETTMIDTSPVPETVQPKKKGQAKTQIQPQQHKSQQPKAKLSIIASKETNSLIVTALPEEFNEIKRVIKELDIVREQVYIESLIVEVSADSGWNFGIDWMVGNQWGSHIGGTSNITGGVPNFTTPSGLTGKTLPVPLGTGFQLGYLADRSILGYVLLNASASDSNFNVLSTPQVLAIDNNESEINVGEEIPVPTNNRISDTGTQFFTYEYKSVGVKLKCKPHITNKAAITMDLFLEVNSVLGDTTVLDSGSVIPPKLGRRDFKTKVTVADGKTIVVGGLIRNEKSKSESYIPILGQIPLLGNLFKRYTVSDSKTNLLVFITPYIVTKQDKADALTNQKKSQQRRLKFFRK